MCVSVSNWVSATDIFHTNQVIGFVVSERGVAVKSLNTAHTLEAGVMT